MLTVSSPVTLGFLCGRILTTSPGIFCTPMGGLFVSRALLLQADLPGQILMPVEGPDEANYYEGTSICLHRSACNKCLESVNSVNKEYLLAGCSIPDLLWFPFAVVLLSVYFLCSLCVCV